MQRFPALARLVALSKSLALTLGGPGLVLLTFLDSSFMPLPFVDLIVLTDSIAHPAWWLYYAVMATTGSLGGCYVLYALARAGGHSFVARRVHVSFLERGLGVFRRWGLLTVVVPAMLPPGLPFKPFVLFAGLAEVSRVTFILAVIAGRFFRYGAEALVACLYGQRAIDLIDHNLGRLSIGLAVAIAVLGLGVALWRRRSARNAA